MYVPNTNIYAYIRAQVNIHKKRFVCQLLVAVLQVIFNENHELFLQLLNQNVGIFELFTGKKRFLPSSIRICLKRSLLATPCKVLLALVAFKSQSRLPKKFFQNSDKKKYSFGIFVWNLLEFPTRKKMYVNRNTTVCFNFCMQVKLFRKADKIVIVLEFLKNSGLEFDWNSDGKSSRLRLMLLRCCFDVQSSIMLHKNLGIGIMHRECKLLSVPLN